MKEYKIKKIRLEQQTDPSRPDDSIKTRVRELFIPTELSTGDVLTENAEKLMEEMSRDGWEVAGTAAIGQYPENAVLIITFSREK